VTNCSSIFLDTTFFAVLFFFDFVTCPCSFWTKRHDNLFVYDDDDDDDNGHSMKTTSLPTSDKSQQAMVQAEMNSLQHAVHFALHRCHKPCGNVPLGYQCFLCVHYHCQLSQTHTTDFPVIVVRCTGHNQQHKQ